MIHQIFHKKNGPSVKSLWPIIAELKFFANGQVKKIAKARYKSPKALQKAIFFQLKRYCFLAIFLFMNKSDLT